MSKANVKARRKRLLVLADFLEGTVLPMLDGAKFDMGTWGRWRTAKPEPKKLDQTSECGFAGCAVGWGYYCPELRRAGIRRVLDSDHGERFDSMDNTPEEFFGIALDESPFYSGGRGRRGLVAVAKRLRKLAAKHGVQP